MSQLNKTHFLDKDNIGKNFLDFKAKHQVFNK